MAPASATEKPKLRRALRIEPLPEGFSLGAVVCSYGFSMLAPNVWRPPAEGGKAAARKRSKKGSYWAGSARRRQPEGQLERSLRRSDGSAVPVVIRQPLASRLDVLVPARSGKLSSNDVHELRNQVVRMLRLLPRDDAVAKGFVEANADLASRGGVGRLFRSPCLFEDLVKTFTLCNCGWGRTITMNERLCSHFGAPDNAFPSAKDLALVRPEKLRALCAVGYRAERISKLARQVVSGELDLHMLDTLDDDEAVRRSCSSIYGFGPFGVANAMQLLGHFARIPADSETVRHLRQARGMRSPTLENVGDVAARVYRPYAPLQFMRYWTELWQTYEDRMGGRACDVDAEQYRLAAGAYMKVRRQQYDTPRKRRYERRIPAAIRKRQR